MAAVAPAQLNERRDAATITVIPKSSPQDERTSQLVDRLRDDVLPAATAGTGAEVYVGGATAIFEDLANKIASRLPVFIALVVGLSVILLMAVFRSVWVPLVSAVFNLLSIPAAYGVVVAVFQYGWGRRLLGVDGEVPIVSFVPLFMFAILFGLSMDYNVFLQSRIREEYHRGAGPSESVVLGLSRVARMILAAGAIMARRLPRLRERPGRGGQDDRSRARARDPDRRAGRAADRRAGGDRAARRPRLGAAGWLDRRAAAHLARGRRAPSGGAARPAGPSRMTCSLDSAAWPTSPTSTPAATGRWTCAAATASGSPPTSRPSRTRWTSTLLEALESVRLAGRGGRPRLRHGPHRAPGCASTASRQIDGVDLTPEMLEVARGRGAHRRLVEADVAATGLEDEAYDLVVTSLVDEHLADLRPLYAEAYRLAKPGARYVLVGYHPHFIMAAGMPTHFDSASGEPVAIETHVHLLSEHTDAALAAGWELAELQRAPDRRRLARAQAQVGAPARPAGDLRLRLAALAQLRARSPGPSPGRAGPSPPGRGSSRRGRPGSGCAAAWRSARVPITSATSRGSIPVSCSIFDRLARAAPSIIGP